MFYKLGSQLDTYEIHEEGKEKFEWNICLMASEYGHLNQSVYIGTRTIHDPVIRLARELVNELNKK